MLELDVCGGGSARLCELSGDHVVLSCSVSRPPGSMLQLSLAQTPFQVKVRGCRRQDDGRFRIDGRLINLTRAGRELLNR